MSRHPPPRVSVVLPVWNAAATLGEAIRSITEQTLREWELIVVDDGSDDGSLELARRAERDDPRVRVVQVERGGIVAALAQGTAAARSRYLARMDADDWCEPARLERQVAFLDAHPEVGLVSCLVRFGGRLDLAAGYALHVDWLNSIVSAEDIARERFVESPFAHPSVCFRTSLLHQHGGYRQGDFPEDYELWLRWLEAGVKMVKVPQVLLEWRDHPHRLSRSDRRYSPEAFFRVKAPFIVAQLQRTFAHQGAPRAVWIWGAGRPTRKRADWLKAAGIELAGYIDIDPRKTGRVLGQSGARVVSADTLPLREHAFVLVYVANRGARALIRSRLVDAGYEEGRDFLVCA